MYSCMTCRLLVTNQEIQREHYQSDWHRYNLKRKVASLPSVSLEAFLHKASAQEALLITAESCRRQNWNCFICKKHFASEKQLNNHLTSKKHLALATRSKSAHSAESVLHLLSLARTQLIRTYSVPLLELISDKANKFRRSCHAKFGPAGPVLVAKSGPHWPNLVPLGPVLTAKVGLELTNSSCTTSPGLILST